MNLIHNLVNPETGKSYKEENLERQHLYPVGTLVELETGCRLFVVGNVRDCDGTPLYRLAVDPAEPLFQSAERYSSKTYGSYSEQHLRPIIGAARSQRTTVP